MNLFGAEKDVPAVAPISPFIEAGAFEVLWDRPKSTTKSLSELFKDNPDARPSDLVDRNQAEEYASKVWEFLKEKGVRKFGIRVHGTPDYPTKLRDMEHPSEVVYFRGAWDLVESPSVSVVGTREPTAEGCERARKLTAMLVDDGFTIISGLAKGIDTVAHSTALKLKGRTIAVVGTPLGHIYPKENASLQETIATDHLLVSQVPVIRYSHQIPKYNKLFFPERNKTMAALSLATIIVEAGETSGTLIQARAALQQGRKLFILDSCFRNPDLTWPASFEKRGAVRVRTYDDIKSVLGDAVNRNRQSEC